jgi:hypothetical protein
MMHNYCTPYIIQENFENFLINQCNYILLSQVYCVWQVVKTSTIILNNLVCTTESNMQIHHHCYFTRFNFQSHSLISHPYTYSKIINNKNCNQYQIFYIYGCYNLLVYTMICTYTALSVTVQSYTYILLYTTPWWWMNRN